MNARGFTIIGVLGVITIPIVLLVLLAPTLDPPLPTGYADRRPLPPSL